MEEETQKKSRGARKRVKRVALSVVGLLVLLVAAGVAYTWYTGRQGPAVTAVVPAVQNTPPEPIRPSVPSAATQESAAVEFLSTPVPPGSDASINIKTVATSVCSISVMYDTQPGTDPGLKPKTADDFGNVSWDWKVPANAPIGTWPVKVTCVRGAKSAVVIGDLQVARQ
ncbi:MAG TPA: hypothetical protein VFH39_02580 [Candidatus Saccharimonadales bacterium]|nr:hypothetical protein [Candidatus Saccharimonadales bacterium]